MEAKDSGTCGESNGSNYCGVNPVTGNPGIRDDKAGANGLRAGGFGNIRPGNGGPGGFHERKNDGHQGIDIVAPVGTKIVASMSGNVIKIVRGFTLANTSLARSAQNGGYGNAVTIRYKNGLYGYYAHLTEVLADEGEIRQGDVVGTSGRTGNANNSDQPPQDDHLHYGRFNDPFNKDKGRPDRSQKASWIDPVKSLNNSCPQK